MNSNEKVREQVLVVVENQIKENKPPETKATYDRLRKDGFNDLDTKQMMAQCLVVEIFDAVRHGQPYDKKRYIKNLKKLPEEPFE
jgi:hypothetical protein